MKVSQEENRCRPLMVGFGQASWPYLRFYNDDAAEVVATEHKNILISPLPQSNQKIVYDPISVFCGQFSSRQAGKQGTVRIIR